MESILNQLHQAGLERIHGKVLEGQQLDFDDGMLLYRTPDLTAVGYLANLARDLQEETDGVNDMGSTVIEENVVTATEAVFMVRLPEIERLIKDAGLTPARRNTRYEILAVG